MACDEAILAAVGSGEAPAAVRFYGWDPPAVSLGRHQPDPGPAAEAALAAAACEWVRRPTGGRLIHHGGPDVELTYSVVVPLADASRMGGARAFYRRVHEALAVGLARLGMTVALAPRARGLAPVPAPDSRLACFATSVPGEIVAPGGRKLIGSAQRRSRRALLQHGSLPLAGDPAAIPARVWPGSLEPGQVTTASAVAGRRLGFHEVAAALAAGIEETLNVSLRPGVLTPSERGAVRERLDPRRRAGGVRVNA